MSETVLEEATRLVEGDRAKSYGDARADAERFAAIASAATGLEVRPHHFPLIMLAVKMSRIANQGDGWHRDSWVDVCGYARVAEKIHEPGDGTPEGHHDPTVEEVEEAHSAFAQELDRETQEAWRDFCKDMTRQTWEVVYPPLRRRRWWQFWR